MIRAGKTFQYLSIILLVLGTLTAVAQPPAGMPARPGNMQAPPNIGHIYGKIVDSTGRGIRDVSVMILHKRMDTASKEMKEILLKGVSTQANGDFNFEELPVIGELVLNISATGYHAKSETVSLMPKRGAAPAGGMPSFDKDLGNLVLQTDAQQLQAVTVVASNSRLRMDIDKKVFNVDQNIVSAGGTAVDVMRNVPSVNVDMDGGVTLRNASPQIFVDGRPTTLTLDQIPADAIESVEIITNPSAKYDASGGNAGILNIILKKNKKKGYNGNVNVGVDKRGALNGGASLNVRQDKFNFSLSAFGNQMKNRNTSETDIKSLLTTPSLLVDQQGTTRMNGGFLFGRAGVDYFATNRATFSLGVVKVRGSFSPGDFLRTDSSYENGDYISYSQRNTTTDREFNATGLQGGFKYLFPKKGEELTADVNYFAGKSNNNSIYITDNYVNNGGAQTGTINQQIVGNGTNSFITMQTDYVTPLSSTAKLEAGARAQLRNLTNGQANYFYDAPSSSYKQVQSSTTNYENKDNVYAGYLSFTNSYKSFGYQVGLRAESSDYEGILTDTKETFTNKYPISLFPSLFLSQKLKNNQELQLSGTRRINRPFFMQLIPFIDSTDQLNWSRGNAGLKPEFTNSIEASYSKTFAGNNTILFSVYYKHTTDLITRFLDTVTLADGTKRPVSTYVNANSSRSTGAEITSQNTITKWWDMNSNLNVYNSVINTDNITGTSQDAIWSWFAKVNNTFKLPYDFKIQLSGTYQSKTNLPVNTGGGGPGAGGPPNSGAQSAAQGYIRSNYGIDLAIQKSFLKSKAASVTLSVNDVFATRKYDAYSESTFFIQNSYRLNDVPMFRLNFSFRFGQMDMNLFKRKNMKGESEGAQGAMQGIGG
jgi:outer membrane receptor protein involved in Fe transport